MTIGDLIKERVDAMPPSKQRKALTLVEGLDTASRRKQWRTKPSKPTGNEPKNYIPKDPALRAIAGIWKDRTDLPKDPVKAVKVIRERMRSRGRNG